MGGMPLQRPKWRAIFVTKAFLLLCKIVGKTKEKYQRINGEIV
jgi:hypothetical protein